MTSYDLVVIGSGAAGLTTAVLSAHLGLKVLVIEKAKKIGGTTARSEGMIWVPDNLHARSIGIKDDVEDINTYIREIAGNHYNEGLAKAYVDNASKMLELVEKIGAAHFKLALGSVDYEQERNGASKGTRALNPLGFDGRNLARSDFDLLADPLPTTMLFGGMTIESADFEHYFGLTKTPKAWWVLANRVGRYAVDRLMGYRRGTRLAGGHGLIASLFKAARGLNIDIRTATSATELLMNDKDEIMGVRVESDGKSEDIKTTSVCCASGGFAGSMEQKARFFDHVAVGKAHVNIAAPTATGDGADMAVEVGAVRNNDISDYAAWAPVSLVPQQDGSTVPIPHFTDRNKPGFLAVSPKAKRFVNESGTYHRFVPAMVEACADLEEVSAWLICDHAAIRRYGMGRVGPAPTRLAPHIRSGYLFKAATIADLADKVGLDKETLSQTVTRFNDYAEKGQDPDFDRGKSDYDIAQGDAEAIGGHPSLGPVANGPFYAMKLWPADISSFLGLKIDHHARVLREDGTIIKGLYATGNDATSPFGGAYPGAGATIGFAMTFAYIVARHAAS